MDCLFCSIINKEKTADIIYEDDVVTAFLDIFPCTEGHTVVIPKRHMENLLEMNQEELGPFLERAQRVLGMLHDKLKPRGFTIGINHGKLAGQAIEHLHLHLIPRYEGDGGGSIHSVVKQENQRAIKDIFNIISN